MLAEMKDVRAAPASRLTRRSFASKNVFGRDGDSSVVGTCGQECVVDSRGEVEDQGVGRLAFGGHIDDEYSFSGRTTIDCSVTAERSWCVW